MCSRDVTTFNSKKKADELKLPIRLRTFGPRQLQLADRIWHLRSKAVRQHTIGIGPDGPHSRRPREGRTLPPRD